MFKFITIENDIDRIIKRPNIFIGFHKYITRKNTWIIKSKNNKLKMINKDIIVNDGLERIFMEPLYNIIDNYINSLKGKVSCKEIRIDITDDCKITMMNDGPTIPIEKNEKGKYIPEQAFGVAYTSTNYDDDTERTTSGQNGLGVKLTNIFSKYFKVETYNKKKKILYTQEWSNNMRDRKEPVLVKEKQEKGYTKVEFLPDFKYFNSNKGLTEDLKIDEKMLFNEDMKGLLHKYIITASFITGLDTYYNGELIKIKKFKDYAKLFQKKSENILSLKSDDSEVIIIENDGYNHCSFVNGCETYHGGIHVDDWTEAICRPIVDKINGKKVKEGNKITIRDVKNYLMIFVNSKVDKPAFDSQSKTKLKGPKVQTKFETKDLNKMMKWEFVNDINNLLKSKSLANLKKLEKKKGDNEKIPKYTKANNLKKDPEHCILIICEGLSAKSSVLAGFQVGLKNYKYRDGIIKDVDMDYLGVFPVQGKICNVRNAKNATILKNKEIKGLIKSTGLKIGADYSDPKIAKTLSYGEILIMTDADLDGVHITSLTLNMFDVLTPSLSKLGYIKEMISPIICIENKGNNLFFYDKKSGEEALLDPKYKNANVRYLKGLGSSDNSNIVEYFGKKIVEYKHDKNASHNLDLFFNKKETKSRKEIMTKFIESDVKSESMCNKEDYSLKLIKTSDFLNNRLVEYSVHSLTRAIPSIKDGLKDVQRIALYCAFKKKLTENKSMGVPTIGGFAIEQVKYHHGPQSIDGAVVGMCQTFVGSNNIPYFVCCGQAGSRLEGGKDAASARYLTIKMMALTKYIYNEEDFNIIPFNYDENQQTEYKYFLQVIPMVLVNGCSGIATGWSTDIPCYNPLDIIHNIKVFLKKEEKMIDMIPWYNNFTGKIKLEDNKVKTYGKLELIKTLKNETSKYKVTELPIGLWTQDFLDKLEELESEKKIIEIKNRSNVIDGTINIDFMTSKDFNPTKKNLGLITNISTTNMVLFDTKDRIKKYAKVQDILLEFCEFRSAQYLLRKNYQLNNMKEILKYSNNKLRFINSIITKVLIIEKKSNKDIIKELEENKYDKKSDSFNYLLHMHMSSVSIENYEKLKNEVEKLQLDIKQLEDKSHIDIWNEELDLFKTNYLKWKQ